MMYVHKRITDNSSADHLLIYVRKKYILEVDKYSDDQPRDENGRWTSGGGSSSVAHDSGSGNVKITDEAIANVPNVNIFDDKEKNARYQQANKDLLKEAQKHPVGTEVSRVYGADMKPIEGYGHRVGDKLGQVKIDDPGVPYHAFHNHPSGDGLGADDLLLFSERNNQMSITAIGNNGKNYCMIRTSESRTIEYTAFLHEKMSDKIFGGNKFSYFDVMEFQPKEYPELFDETFINELKTFHNDCIKGGEQYGFRYIESGIN